ncbi:MAG: dTMP kinase [Gemmatimonadaceae bacterium]
MSERGLFIVLEGVEGVGKTTQWARLRDRLQSIGKTVIAVREPGGPNVGEFIRQLLLSPELSIPPGTEALLFAASRAEVTSTVIEPAIERGDTVLVDRFLLSTYAYQGGGRGIKTESLRTINAFATGGLKPDVTLLLSLPLDAALARAAQRSAPDRIEKEDRSFHVRVASTFRDATTSDWQTAHPDCGRIVQIDASGSADEVTERCVTFLAQQWPSRLGALLDETERSFTGGTAA